MIYSDTVKYALLALAYLALNKDRLVKVEEIAEVQNIPRPFLSKIFHKLSREMVLKSYKGPSGGFTFAIPPENITILDVMRYLDEDYKLDLCALRSERCEKYEYAPCIVHDKWTKLRKEILEYLRTTTIADLAEVEANFVKNKEKTMLNKA